MGANTTAADGAATIVDVELVKKSMQWDEDAFRKVYEATYYRMLYIAKKYMKNDAAAEDVLQEAYIKIWTNLPQLGQPEAYVSWASRIVANTALNELRKTQPTLFSEMSAEGEDGSEMAFDVEDTYVPNQPELSFTDAEEQQIIREMIDSLSDEQRMCILMYYMENLSVREIAETMGCSEGTVKSRLNYGRQNIKAKAEELQKKGYNFKGISALAVLLLLLGREAARVWAKPVVVSTAAATPAAAAAATTPQAVAGVGQAGPAGAFSGGMATNAGGAGAGSAGGMAPNTGGAGAGTAPAGTAQTGAAIPNAGGSGAGAAPAKAKAAAKAAEAGASGAAKAGFFASVGGKIFLAVAGVLVVGGIVALILLMTKGKKEEPSLEASNTSAEAITEENVTEVETEAVTEAVTEASTEPVTEEVTEEPAEYYAYVDAYAAVLAEHKDTIQLFETIDYLKNNGKSVALVDINKDEIPELFTVEAKSRNEAAFVSLYTCIDGKAVLVKNPQNDWNPEILSSFSAVAGGGEHDTGYLAKDGEGFYWKTKEGDETRYETVFYYTLSGDTLNATVVDESYKGPDGSGHPTVMTEETEANMGDVIISNTELSSESMALSYDDAAAMISQLQVQNYHDPGWQKIDDKWYYYSKSGHLQTGWLEDEGKWYFLSATGEMYTGWKTIKGKTYYFNEKGAMAIGEVTIDSQTYKFDETGVLIEGEH